MHADPAGDGFAEAVKAITALPLSDAEKAEAIRRLLNAPQQTGPTVPPEHSA